VNTDLSLLSLIANATFLVKMVMLILLGMSISSWALIFQRGLMLRKAKAQFKKFQERFYGIKDLNRLHEYLAGRRTKTTGIEQVFKFGFREFLKLHKQDALPTAVMTGTERALRVALAQEEQRLEESLPYLAQVGSISVYIGLFGTVWGIMTAFQALGSVQQATLAMVAPGISEALIATALGLFAAIPAVFAYNRYIIEAQNLVRSYDCLAEEFSNVLHRRLYTTQSWQETSAKAPREEIEEEGEE
jgi:biopolymer transport protein TolQ